MERMGAYCRADVDAEALLDQKLPELSAIEREVWLATERLNDRGVLADLTLVEHIAELVEQARPAITARIQTLTGAATVNCRARLEGVVRRARHPDGEHPARHRRGLAGPGVG